MLRPKARKLIADLSEGAAYGPLYLTRVVGLTEADLAEAIKAGALIVAGDVYQKGVSFYA